MSISIAGVILAFVMTYELILMVIDTWLLFKWIFKAFVAVLLVTNNFNIVMGILDMAQCVVNSAPGVISADASVDLATKVAVFQIRLIALELGTLIVLWFQSLFISFTMQALNICIFLVICGRMIEIFLVTPEGPIPMAIIVNREWGGGMGQYHLRFCSISGLSHYGLCRHLRRTDAEHLLRNGHHLGCLDHPRLYRPALFHSVQGWKSCQINI